MKRIHRGLPQTWQLPCSRAIFKVQKTAMAKIRLSNFAWQFFLFGNFASAVKKIILTIRRIRFSDILFEFLILLNN